MLHDNERVIGRRLPVLFFIIAALAWTAEKPSVLVESLRCEYRTNPLGIDVLQPRLSWQLVATDPTARGLRQSAYRVLVASDEEALRADRGDLWDSGKVMSGQSIHVTYAGKPLASRAQAFWKVQVWDQAGKPSGWCGTARWSMGLIEPTDWAAKWIGRDEEKLFRSPRSPYWNLEKAHWIWFPSGDPAKSAPAGSRFFRCRIGVPERPIRRALCIIGADNSFELFLNGDRIGRGSNVAIPDVFELSGIKSGENVLAVRATNRNNRPAGLIAAVRIEFASGDPMLITTGSEWKTAESAAGWEKPGFDDSRWQPAKDLGAFGMAPWGEVGFREERALPARMLRKEFDSAGKPRRAVVYVSGLGLSELYLNGTKVGDHVLSPNLTEYDKRVFYVALDVTDRVLAGRNAIGLMLGNGRYWAPRERGPMAMRSFGYPKAIVQLELEYPGGKAVRVASDETWKLTTDGPIRANNEFDGEEYDARREISGWSRVGFNDSSWETARIVEAPKGVLVAQMAEPLRVTRTLKPVTITEPRPGQYVFDLGQNMVGWCRLRVAGPAGAEVSLRHAETLQDDGTLYVDNLRSARARDLYTLKGRGVETWEPRFTYHGFRYVEVSGFPGKPTLDAIEGRVVHDSMAEIADFSSSNELLNHIHRNIVWGVRGNYRSIPTDCPQRDERQGWLGDRSMVSRTESYLFDVAAFYSKWAQDLVDSQRPTGSIPDVAPPYWVLYNDNVTWPSTFLFVPAMLYDQYADRRILERNYAAMKKWIDYMRTFLKDDLMPKDTYGDWCVPPESPKLIHSQDPGRRTDGTLIGTAYYYHLLRLMSRVAGLLDRQADAADFQALAARVKTAFQRKFFDAGKGVYGNGTQTSSVLALAFDLAPPENRKPVLAALVRKIEEESRGHVGTGLVGAQWLMRALSDNGRPDLAYAIATQRTYPGWGYMIEKGATTIWELWNGDTADPAMNSGNHVMQIGDLGVWMYEYLAGIRPDPTQPGFRHVNIRPAPVKDLTFVKASHKSMYGPIATHWRQSGDRFELDVELPPNTAASVYVPAREAASVTESGRPAQSAPGVRFVRMESGAAVFEVGSGAYSFAALR